MEIDNSIEAQILENFLQKLKPVYLYYNILTDDGYNLEHIKDDVFYPIEEITHIAKDIITNKTIYHSLPIFKNRMYREAFIYLWGWTVLTLDWIKPLADYLKGKKCLEVMSGTGGLAYALRQQGIDIIATDNYSRERDNNHIWWLEPERLHAPTAVKRYGKEVDYIIMSWCEYKDNICVEVLKTMRNVNPNCILIEIGEDAGCTGVPKFYNTAQYIEDPAFDTVVSAYQKWQFIYDRPKLLK